NSQDAIDAAGAGDVIVVSDGTYNNGGRIVYGAMTNRVVADKAVTIQSLNGAAATLIAGTRNANVPPTGIRCVYLTNGASLIGFTLTNGATRGTGDVVREQSGGGVWCADSSVTVANCAFAGNAAALYGGGAFQGVLFNCTFTNNSASYGGGAASNTVCNGTFTRNSSVYQNFNYGGGAYGCVLSNCLITGNQAVAGGGLGGGAAFSSLTSCVVSNNSAASGGGLYVGNAYGSLISSNRATGGGGGGATSNVLINCVIRNNFATGNGAGAYKSTLLNATVISNTSSISGGGVWGGGLSNCIVYYNTGSSSPNAIDCTMTYCDTISSVTGLGNITNEPVFVNLAGGDLHLQTNSPCINAGNNASAVNMTDYDGNPRIAGGTVDVGAYEYQSPSSLLSYAWAQQYGLSIDGAVDNLDSDGDGLSNWQEWKAGTIPTNAASALKLASPSNSIAGMKVTWQSVTNVTYYLQSATNLAAFISIQSNIAGKIGTTSYIDTTATNGGPWFYRVGVQ
ncbi:MAG: thrombospondin type 3 repeat-containing protein, partial [Verrucomicrobiota bacterium]